MRAFPTASPLTAADARAAAEPEPAAVRLPRVPVADTPAEKARRIGVPVLPPKRRPPRGPGGQAIVAVCGLCGMELSEVMWLACRRDGCPVSSGVTF